MKLFVITPIYATKTEGDGATPLVHYFAREWVKMGHEVTVFNLQAKFPKPYYWVGKLFQHQFNTKLGMLVPTHSPNDEDIIVEGVNVIRRGITKYKPHSDFNKSNNEYAISIIKKEIYNNGIPDVFIGHWGSPNLFILPVLKKIYNRPIVLVFHTNSFNLESRYGSNVVDILKMIDIIGFRSKIAKENFLKKYFKPRRSFICYSGVSEIFLKEGSLFTKGYNKPIRNFIYVGSMIARKHPDCLYDALCKAYPQGDFSIKYIGNGIETEVIKRKHDQCGLGEIVFTGRIPRESIIQHLIESDVFIMISEGEIFGLVYLEAMALGLIPIGSRGEGIDGIIVDGENGFLCKPGDENELASIIVKLKNMTDEQLLSISEKAKATASKFSDYGVAKDYVNNICS